MSRIVPISLYQASAPPPSKILDPPLQAYQNVNPDSITSLFTKHITGHNFKDNLKFEQYTRSESKALLTIHLLTRPVLTGIVYQFSRVVPNSSSFEVNL